MTHTFTVTCVSTIIQLCVDATLFNFDENNSNCMHRSSYAKVCLCQIRQLVLSRELIAGAINLPFIYIYIHLYTFIYIYIHLYTFIYIYIHKNVKKRYGLLRRLKYRFGVSGPALEWFASYLSDRYQYIRIGKLTSSNRQIPSGVPQDQC